MIEAAVVAACIAALASLLGLFFTRQMNERLKRMDVSLKAYEAGLNVMVQGRLHLTKEMVTSAVNMRVKVNGAFGALHKFQSHALLYGREEPAKQFMDACDDATRAIGQAGGLLSDDLVDRSREFMDTFISLTH